MDINKTISLLGRYTPKSNIYIERFNTLKTKINQLQVSDTALFTKIKNSISTLEKVLDNIKKEEETLIKDIQDLKKTYELAYVREYYNNIIIRQTAGERYKERIASFENMLSLTYNRYLSLNRSYSIIEKMIAEIEKLYERLIKGSIRYTVAERFGLHKMGKELSRNLAFLSIIAGSIALLYLLQFIPKPQR